MYLFYVCVFECVSQKAAKVFSIVCTDFCGDMLVLNVLDVRDSLFVSDIRTMML